MTNTSQFNPIPSLPYHMVWISTNACNARCIHCSTDALKAYKNEMSTDEAMNMFSEFASLGIFDIAISGGEPFVRKDIFIILEHIKSLGLKVGIGSNGSTINEAILNRLKEVDIDRIQFSLDGLEATHDKVRNWEGLYKKTVTSIQSAISKQLNVHVCFTVHKYNYFDIDSVIELCMEWGVKRFNLSRIVPTGRGNISLDLPNELWKRITIDYETKRRTFCDHMEFTSHLSQEILVNSELDCYNSFIGCQAGIGQGCVDSRGEVYPCVLLPIEIGNVRDDSFENIWRNSEVNQKLKERNNLKGGCHNCELISKCGGCRAVAYAQTGDYLGYDTRCWK